MHPRIRVLAPASNSIQKPRRTSANPREHDPHTVYQVFHERRKDLLIDIDNRDKDRIHDHVLRVLGKPKETLDLEARAKETKDNPANFGYMCDKHCMCEIFGQVPRPAVVLLPKPWRGKNKNEEL